MSERSERPDATAEIREGYAPTPSVWDDPARPWRSGAWSCELRGDEIADLAYDGRPVLRSIRAVVRDSDWNTAEWQEAEWQEAEWQDAPWGDAPETSGVQARAGFGDEVGAHAAPAPDSTLRLPLQSRGFGSDLHGELTLAAHDDELTVTFTARSRGTYATNRTGLVVLHAASVSGLHLAVRHPDGSQEQTAFPIAISPHQPVVQIAGLSWCDDGLEIDTAFSGDVFEMEDQRNWTDASFKTYSRPLSLPFPYELADKALISQRITVRATPLAAPQPRPLGDPVIALAPAGPAPEIGVATSEAPDPAPSFPGHTLPGASLPEPSRSRPALSGLSLSALSRPTLRQRSLLVELDLRTPTWRATLDRALPHERPLDVRLVIDDANASQLDQLAAVLAERTAGTANAANIARIAAFHPRRHVSDTETVAALRASLAATGVSVPVWGGSRSHFTELNRALADIPHDLDGIVTTVTPLFHSLSTAQLVESVAMQRIVARQVVSVAYGAPVRIGPISLRPRFNNVATQPQPAPTRSDLAEGYGAEFTGASDARQSAPELAAWTIASAAALAVTGVAGLTYFEEWGPRGVRSASGETLPVAAAVAALQDLVAPATGYDTALPSAAHPTLLSGDSPDGLIWTIGVRAEGELRLIAANLDTRPRSWVVTVPGTHADVAADANTRSVRRIPVALGPLNWARIKTS